jgi:hypothetical protein
MQMVCTQQYNKAHRSGTGSKSTRNVTADLLASLDLIYSLVRACDFADKRLVWLDKMISRTPIKKLSTKKKSDLAIDIALIKEFMGLLTCALGHRLKQMGEHFMHFFSHYLDKLTQPLGTNAGSLLENDSVGSEFNQVFNCFVQMQTSRSLDPYRIRRPPSEFVMYPFGLVRLNISSKGGAAQNWHQFHLRTIKSPHSETQNLFTNESTDGLRHYLSLGSRGDEPGPGNAIIPSLAEFRALLWWQRRIIIDGFDTS